MSIIFTGDFAPNSKEQSIAEDVFDYMSKAEFTCVNLEGVIASTDKKPTKSKGISISINRNAINILPLNNIIFGLNNNHSTDFGIVGLRDTVNTLDSLNISSFGYGMIADEKSFFKSYCIDGHSVAIIGITLDDHGVVFASENRIGLLSFERAKLIIQSAMKTHDRVVVTVHGGVEFITVPSPSFRKYCRMLAKLRVDVIIGHHCHVPQGYEKMGDTHVFFCLGNFIMDIPYHCLYRNTEYSYLVELFFLSNKVEFDFKVLKTINGKVKFYNNGDQYFHKINSRLANDQYRAVWRIGAMQRVFSKYNTKDIKQLECSILRENQCVNKNYVIQNKKYLHLARVIKKICSLLALAKHRISRDILFAVIGWRL